MKKMFGFVTLVLVLFTACSNGTGKPAQTRVTPSQPAFPFLSLQDHDWDDRSVFQSNLITHAQGVLEELPQASVYHISLIIPPEINPVTASLAVRYTNAEEISLQEIYFRLFPNVNGGRLDAANIRVDGQPAQHSFENQTTSLSVALEKPLDPGDSVIIEMDFQLQIATQMGGSYGLFGFFENVLVLDTFYPMIPVYDQNGWHKDQPSLIGDFTYNDVSFYLVEVTAPPELVLIAAGVEINRRELDGQQVVTYAAGPARDFYLAASDEYTVVSTQFGETTVNSYALANQDEFRDLALQFGHIALGHFSDRFGLYPYTEFDIISSPMLALGIEYPGIVGINHLIYDPNEDAYGTSNLILLESVVAHETGHQWFYNVVGNDQENQPWLDESITQYATYLYYLDTYGDAGAQGYYDSFYNRWDSVNRTNSPIGQPALNYSGRNYSAIIYGRGPLFLLELEDFIGSETFAELMRDYYQSNLWGIGTTEDFRLLAEDHCDCSLAEFWADWITR